MTRVAMAEDRQWFVVDDPAMSGSIRRAAVALGAEVKLGEVPLANLAIVALEIATNVARHAERGRLLLRLRRRHDAVGVEMVATDHGPGMADVSASSRDGVSTAGTLGIGLGAIARLADESDIYSWPERGTVATATVWSAPLASGTDGWIDGLSRPIAGEEVCGDGYAARVVGDRRQLLMCDGLGHGELAHRATRAVVDAFLDAPDAGPRDVLAHVSAKVRHTRGAVTGIAEMGAGTVRYAGIGNIGAAVADERSRRAMVSLPGIIGQSHRDIREYEYDAPPGALVVLHSDGLTDHWNLKDYPGLVTHRPLAIAATLLRDAGRARDDAAVLVARTTGARTP